MFKSGMNLFTPGYKFRLLLVPTSCLNSVDSEFGPRRRFPCTMGAIRNSPTVHVGCFEKSCSDSVIFCFISHIILPAIAMNSVFLVPDELKHPVRIHAGGIDDIPCIDLVCGIATIVTCNCEILKILILILLMPDTLKS